MFAEEGVKFWLIACEKKSDRFVRAPATEVFQDLIGAKPFVDIFLAVF
jgi:hypothetical protein